MLRSGHIDRWALRNRIAGVQFIQMNNDDDNNVFYSLCHVFAWNAFSISRANQVKFLRFACLIGYDVP